MTFGFFSFAGAQPSGIFSTLKIGGGGFVTGYDLQLDGTKLARTDTAGAWKLNTVSGLWEQLITRNSMPGTDNGVDSSPSNLGYLVTEIAAAPTNTNRLYMIFKGYVFTSTNKGANWTRTSFTQDQNAGGNYRHSGRHIAVDPQNELIAYAGVPTGLFVTTDGGATWNVVVGGFLPPTTTNHGSVSIAFDPTSSVTGGAKQGIYAASYGRGVYHSTNGGSSWTLTSGTPTTCNRLICDAAGIVWLTDDASAPAAPGVGNLNKLLSGTWSTAVAVGTNPCHSVAVNPTDGTKVYAAGFDGKLMVSTNTGGSFVGPTTISCSASDIPWLGFAFTDGSFGTGEIVFDPHGSNLLYNANGIGCFNTNPPTTNTNVTWISQSAGIENLVVTTIVGIAPGKPLICCWDRPGFILTPGTYPSTYGGAPLTGALSSSFGGDVDPTGAVAMINAMDVGGAAFGTASTTPIPSVSWSQMASQTPATTNHTRGGSMAVSTTTHALYLPKDNGSGANGPWTTTNAGGSWIARNVGGTISATGPTGWGENYYEDTIFCAADKVTADTYYLYNDGNRNVVDKGIWRSTDGGATWTQVYSGGFGSGFIGAGQLKAVPGKANHLFFTMGNQGFGNHPATTQLWQSTNGGQNWNPIANVGETFCVGFGAIYSGQSYPAIFFVGWVSSVYGVWKSIDNFATAPVKVGDGFPAGNLQPICDCYGDMGVVGQLYMATYGGGAFIGTGL